MRAVKPSGVRSSKPAPRPVRHVIDVRERAQAQEWIYERFSQISPDDLHNHRVMVFVATVLEPPASFEDVWSVINNDNDASILTLEEVKKIKQCAAILLVADPSDSLQVTRICLMAQQINLFAPHAVPPIIWVPHSVAPEIRGGEGVNSRVLEHVLDMGAHDVIFGEPKGWELAMNVRSKINKQLFLPGKIREKCEEQIQEVELLQQSVHCIVWEYASQRLKTRIPAVDRSFPKGIPSHLNSLAAGKLLGKGTFGKVYRLMRMPGQIPSGQVMKCMDKEEVSTISGMMSVHKTIDIMTFLSKEWPHPNIIKFYEAYHSPSHIILRMEDGGTLNLYRRLVLRDWEKRENVPLLSITKVLVMTSQMLQAVEHLHSTCHCVHRDIKPENICVKENLENIQLKFTDFDLALVAAPTHRCKGSCGTFPFAAPEVYLQTSYKPFPADIWSLGIVLLEIFCGVYTLELSMGFLDEDDLHAKKSFSSEERKSHNMEVANHFLAHGAAGKLINACIREELRTLEEPSQILLDHMIQTSAEHRLSAKQTLFLLTASEGD